VRLSEAPSHGKPCLLYDLRCPGTKSYLAVADEFLDRTLVIEAPPPPAPARGKRAAAATATTGALK
jgi:hypothetical protein